MTQAEQLTQLLIEEGIKPERAEKLVMLIQRLIEAKIAEAFKHPKEVQW